MLKVGQKLKFYQDFDDSHEVPNNYPHNGLDIEQEIAFQNVTPERIRAEGGPITRKLLENAPESFFATAKKLKLPVMVDVYIHSLSIGEYPCQRNWHCDYTEIELFNPPIRKSKRRVLLCTVSTGHDGVSNFEFLKNDLVWTPKNDKIPHKSSFTELDEYLRKTQPETVKSVDGRYYVIPENCLHRATPTHYPGYRLLFRMLMDNTEFGRKILRNTNYIYVE